MQPTCHKPAASSEKASAASPVATSGAASHDANNEDADISLTSWPGWVDLLSEPAHFNTLLNDFGVRGVKVHEVVSLEPEIIAQLPRPIHALIFLFRWKQSNRKDTEADYGQQRVWFAQQTADNACASYAVLNIVNNIPGLVLGPELQAFKDRTTSLSPLDRGHEVNAFHFVRAIHNSFATQAELRDADMHLKNAIEKLRKSEAAKARKAAAAATKGIKKTISTSSTPTRSSNRLRTRNAPQEHDSLQIAPANKRCAGIMEDESHEGVTTKKRRTEPATADSKLSTKPRTRRRPIAINDAAYHFCAYMPIDNQLWKLDGLEPTPESIADLLPNSCEAWLEQAVEVLQKYMAGYEDESVGFNIMAVVHDPLLDSKECLSKNVKSVQAVEKKLTEVVCDWEEAQNESDKPVSLLNGADDYHELQQGDIDEAQPPASLIEKLEGLDDLAELLDLRKSIADSQIIARAHLREELVRKNDDEKQSRYYRHDYDGFFDQWLEQLAKSDMLDALVAEQD